MSEIVADRPLSSCYHLLPRTRVAKFQSLSPDPFSLRTRDARGRFAKGSAGNPQGRPPGIRNPKRRVPDLTARPLSAQALSVLDRKPHLLRLLAQLLPPPLASEDPAERLGIDLNSVRTGEDVQRVARAVLTAISRGEIAPVDGAIIARRARARLRAIRRLARFEGRLAHHPSPA